MGRTSHTLKLGGNNLDYENWRVYHPSGRHMFTCGGKKARWYLERDLAKEIGDFQIILNFEPNGHGFEDNEDFGRSIREIQCVVTGIDYELQRHHIVPYCYRTWFPEKYKSKNHHDVVLINKDIHADYERHATEYKDELASIYGVKRIGEFNKAYTQMLREFNRDHTIVLGKLNALFRGYGKMPHNVIHENLEDVADKIGMEVEQIKSYNYIQLYKMFTILKEEYNRELLAYQERHRRFYDHGWHLVKKLDADEKIFDFVKLWRNHFIETMRPQYMPDGWSIDFRHKTRI